jgi:hypothetical protein
MPGSRPARHQQLILVDRKRKMPMDLDEALAVAKYLENRSDTNITVHERTMRAEAWETICSYARATINRRSDERNKR